MALPAAAKGDRRSIRSTLGAVMVFVTALIVLVSTALVLLTTILHRTTTSVGASVESVRLAQQAQVDLLLHARSRDPLLRRALESDILRRLDQANRFVTTSQEEAVLREALAHLNGYMDLARSPEHPPDQVSLGLEEAYAALESLVDLNVDQARQAEERADGWDRVGTVLGVVVGLATIVISLGLLAWLRSRAFQPVFSLAAAMKRFGDGDHEVRADESGPAELVEMNRQFNAMASALAAQRQAQMAFLAGVAHDLRNPLSVLKISTGRLALGKTLPPEPQLRRMLDLLARQVTRLDRMIGDFLDVAHIESGAFHLELGEHDLRRIVREVTELFEGVSPQHRFETLLPSHPVPVHCDPLRLDQALNNLVSNAVKYSPDGGAIRVRLDSRDGMAAVHVSDEGLGIPESDRANIFEAFRRSTAVPMSIPGLGLGLYAVKRIVEAHGGSVEVDSAPGRGSTFSIHLPVDMPSVTDAEQRHRD